jgi:EF-P beta-lysylation protein EpmB
MDRMSLLNLSADKSQTPRSGWQRSLAAAIRDPAELLRLLKLPEELVGPAQAAAGQFPVMVPRSYLARMRTGDPSDPLLRQVLPIGEELRPVPGFEVDAVGDSAARVVPGMLHKYHSRVLLITTGACAVHCRYCFRRHYPYGEEPRRLQDWAPAFEAIEADESIDEVILSGGDPLMLTDIRLGELMERLARIDHLRRVRLHSRLPIVLPERVTAELIGLLRGTRLQTVFVVHANHPQEVADDCEEALRALTGGGVPTLNQSVLLKGVNDDAAALEELSRRLINVGVMPYYLHQLDRVSGTAHFEVERARGLALIDELRRRLPGYAVPQLVEEIAGDASKRPISG